MSRERMLTESDGPFAQIEGRAAKPWDVEKALPVLAGLWSEPVYVVEQQLNENLRRLTVNSAEAAFKEETN